MRISCDGGGRSREREAGAEEGGGVGCGEEKHSYCIDPG